MSKALDELFPIDVDALAEIAKRDPGDERVCAFVQAMMDELGEVIDEFGGHASRSEMRKVRGAYRAFVRTLIEQGLLPPERYSRGR